MSNNVPNLATECAAVHSDTQNACAPVHPDTQVATPDTVTRTKPIPTQEMRELVLDAKAAVQGGFWLFNSEAAALIQSQDRTLRDLLSLLQAGEVDDAVALLEGLTR